MGTLRSPQASLLARLAGLFGGPGRQRLARKTVRLISSGASMIAGQYDWEKAPELRTPEKRHETYRKMATGDPYISEALRHNELPLLSHATWTVRPGDENDERSMRARDLVAANLFGDENDSYGKEVWAQQPWSQRLREILSFLTHGFALFHDQWRVEGSALVYDRLLWLEPESIYRWHLDGSDRIEAVERRYRSPDGTYHHDTLTADELSLYVWDMKGARYEGLPLIRPMYGSWSRKEFLLRVKMIAAQRGGVGVPWATWDEAGEGEEFRTAVEELLQSSLGQGLDTAYLAAPMPSLELNYLQQDARQLEKFDGMVDDENLSIAHGGGTKAQMLGEMPTGSRSVGEVQQRMALIVTEAIAQIIAEQDLRGVGTLRGPIQKLVDRNFDGLKRSPWVTAEGVDPEEKTRSLPLLYDGVKAGLIPNVLDVRRFVSSAVGLSLDDDVLEQDGKPTAPQGQARPPKQPAPDVPDVQEPQPDADPQNAAMGRRLELRLAISDLLHWPADVVSKDDARAAGWGRQPNEFEARFVAMGTVSAAFADGERGILAVLRRAKSAMAEDIVTRGRAGKITRDSLGGLRRSKPKGLSGFLSRMREQFNAVAFAGREHARQELERQEAAAEEMDAQAGAAFARLEGAGGQGDGVLPPGGKVPPPRVPKGDAAAVLRTVIQQLAEESRVLAEMQVEGLWARMVNEAITEYERLSRAGVEGDALWTQLDGFLDELSNRPLEQAARKTATVAYNQGRDITMKVAQANGDAGWVVRSELLDSRTCSSCRSLDGSIVAIDSAAYEELMPPARCEGGDLCRGVYVILSEKLRRAAQ